MDFSKLTLQDALDLAILVEEEAQERYNEFTEQLEKHHTADAASFFREMSGNEAKHGAELRARRVNLFGDTPAKVDRSMIWDVEAPEYAEARIFMSHRQALNVAMDSEKKAYSFFDDALASITNAEVKELFAELRDEELEHQELVEAEIKKLGDVADVDPEDYVDPPVGQ